jgi:hypothetical protein
VEKILLVGDNFRLLAARAAALAKTGSSITCCNVSELGVHLPNQMFDVIVLCHMLTEGVRSSVMANVHRRWPAARILQIFSPVGEVLSAGCSVVALSKAEPGEADIHAIELLGKLPDDLPPQTTRGPNPERPRELLPRVYSRMENGMDKKTR